MFSHLADAFFRDSCAATRHGGRTILFVYKKNTKNCKHFQECSGGLLISAGLIPEHKEIPGNLYSTTLFTLYHFETFALRFSCRIEFYVKLNIRALQTLGFLETDKVNITVI